MLIVINVLLSATVIGVSAYLAQKKPALAGFIVSLPLSTLLVLSLAYVQKGDPLVAIRLAKSISFAVPLSLLFFVPFLLAERFRFSFWTCYGLGLVMLLLSYWIHKWGSSYFLR